MTGPAAEFTRCAAGAVTRLAAAGSLDELEQAAHREFASLGCELTVGALVHRRPGGRQKVDIVFGDTTHPWITHYVEKDLGSRCPITGSAGARPLSWGDIKAKPLTAQQRRVFGELGDFGLLDGQIVTVEGFGEISAVISTAGRHADLDDPHTRTLVHLLSVNYGLLAIGRWCALRDVPRPEPVRLTARQIECLQWALEGKSSSAIAEILGLSCRTVDEHFGHACAALGVRTRVQACAQAARLGLIAF